MRQKAWCIMYDEKPSKEEKEISIIRDGLYYQNRLIDPFPQFNAAITALIDCYSVMHGKNNLNPMESLALERVEDCLRHFGFDVD